MAEVHRHGIGENNPRMLSDKKPARVFRPTRGARKGRAERCEGTRRRCVRRVYTLPQESKHIKK